MRAKYQYRYRGKLSPEWSDFISFKRVCEVIKANAIALGGIEVEAFVIPEKVKSEKEKLSDFYKSQRRQEVKEELKADPFYKSKGWLSISKDIKRKPTTVSTESKVCTKCSKEKPFNEFYKHPNTKDGHASGCKACHNSHRER